jgi:hypothetical protein
MAMEQPALPKAPIVDPKSSQFRLKSDESFFCDIRVNHACQNTEQEGNSESSFDEK